VRLVDELELVLAPVGGFGALVRAVPDLDGLLGDRLTRVVGVEVELDHLPVALVQVVELVERIEDPVLERELPRIAGVARNVRVHRGGSAGSEPARPALVAAAWIERVAGKVEVVLVAADEILGARRDLDEVRRAPRATERHRRLVEEHVDVRRLVRLPGPALLGLLDQSHHRRKPCGERLVVGGIGEGERRCDQRSQRENQKTCGLSHDRRLSQHLRKAHDHRPRAIVGR
jgi:hypothetical protein